MESYNLCFAWNWQYDRDFAELLSQACWRQELSLLQVTPANLEEILVQVVEGQLHFQAYFDRASDTDDNFYPLVEAAYQQAQIYLNRFEPARRACDKAAMHRLLTRSGLDTPFTIVLPSYLEQPEISPVEPLPFGEPFAIKPAHGGGGNGVIPATSSWEEVLAARQTYPGDQYLLQAHVDPIRYDGRPAWFRIIYCTGQIIPFWWDPYTHTYFPLSCDDQIRFNLQQLDKITHRLAQLCRLELFSTEIALAQSGQFLVIDYINDPIDLRMQSHTPEGVPDAAVETIAGYLVDYVVRNCRVYVDRFHERTTAFLPGRGSV